MRKSCIWIEATLFIALLCIACASSVRFHLDHPQHSSATKRHQLSSRKHLIHHDMRVFSMPSSHLAHDAVTENYGLNQMGYYFTLNLTIDGLPYRLNIDTGSSDIFIKGENSPGQPAKKYTCPSCLHKNQKLTIGYLDGRLDTYKTILPVKFGEHAFNQSILVAYTAPKSFEAAEGLLGLSFPQIAKNRDPTFIQTLINNKIISEYAFGVNLNFQQHHRSFISLGAPDTDLFEGTLKKYSLNTGYSYSIKVKGVSVGSGSLLPISSGLLDTGNTCITIPNSYEKAILAVFNKDGNTCGFDKEEYTPMFSLLRCKVRNFQKLPTIKIYINDDVYEIDKDTYIQRCIKKKGGDLCDTYLESVRSISQLLIGDGFFNRFYTYFDLGKREIGFAKNKEKLSYKNMYKDESEFDDEDKQFFARLK